MKPVKRIEIVLPQREVDHLIAQLEARKVSGYTRIPSVVGRGERGLAHEALGNLDNSYLLVACDESEVEGLIESIRPFLKRFGGICLVSDAQWVLH
jgi:nitrogen regulatory protein PII